MKDVAIKKSVFDAAREKFDSTSRVTLKNDFYGTFTQEGGIWTMGREKTPIPDDLYVVNIQEMAEGWICWSDGEFVEEITVPLLLAGKKPPLYEDLPDHGPYKRERDGWEEQRVFPLKGINTGTEVTIKKGNTDGMVQAYAALADEIITRGQLGKDPWPVISLQSRSYDNKKHGSKTWVPIFNVQYWIKDPNVTVQTGKVLDDAIPF